MNCPLCEATSNPFHQNKFRSYSRCTNCFAIFMDFEYRPTNEEEKKRYLEHNNDILDTNYQNFLKPIVEKVIQFQTPEDSGMDFGAGPGPVVAYLLKQSGYEICLYDPYFHPNEENLSRSYDYIILTEVVEHFHDPKKEFQKLHSLLKPKGRLYILTHPYDDSIVFENWYYKNDQTHTFFYTKNTFDWIKSFFEFQSLEILDRIILFQK
ncbi:Methyltransferase/methylase [Leptospira biflexa serovar Patoc strain 'Patoc 1 (Ames)']|uniref:Putative methyltransferase n=1 Tax=Leptospira biflexa serovar Patoc (strain Patoc 1 / ATCC 23582 / Paris) TaxID=456481 RepID=B0SMN3_LEPBP|nr:Methyltransferase/methylase [Leptospira biflexa serovar Patoc strain 'Patoc 1 (Ames)']ABZ98757.1 Putative methyltransferase [Leptospira biflexa serovar Patoc strain 'Patoc 1 (Paris)']